MPSFIVNIDGVDYQVDGAADEAEAKSHAMTQHVILSTGRFETIGRVMLGLDPGLPII